MQYALYGLQMRRRSSDNRDMSDNKNIIEKTSDTVDNVSKFQKLSKLKAGYFERDEFKNSNLQKGFFCYNCIYWIDITGGKCMVVDNKGPDLFGNVSDVIAPYGCCNGYESDFDEINEQQKK